MKTNKLKINIKGYPHQTLFRELETVLEDHSIIVVLNVLSDIAEAKRQHHQKRLSDAGPLWEALLRIRQGY